MNNGSQRVSVLEGNVHDVVVAGGFRADIGNCNEFSAVLGNNDVDGVNRVIVDHTGHLVVNLRQCVGVGVNALAKSGDANGRVTGSVGGVRAYGDAGGIL